MTLNHQVTFHWKEKLLDLCLIMYCLYLSLFWNVTKGHPHISFVLLSVVWSYQVLPCLKIYLSRCPTWPLLIDLERIRPNEGSAHCNSETLQATTSLSLFIHRCHYHGPTSLFSGHSLLSQGRFEPEKPRRRTTIIFHQLHIELLSWWARLKPEYDIPF